MEDKKRAVVNEQLEGKNILITGCSGFLGKVLLEKIIRSIPNVANLYLLVRGSDKYKTGKERFNQEIACSSIFNSLKAHNLEAFESFCDHKIHIVSGELTEPLFGLAENEFKALSEKLDLIVNSAASVNFREELDKALKINTLCLNNIILLSKSGGNLPVVQVSTCYVHGFNKGEIYEETMAPARELFPQSKSGLFLIEEVVADLEQKIASLKLTTNDEKSLKDNLVELGAEQAQRYGWNDVYTFTKWMGEQLLLEKLQGQSLAILRPAIIESTLKAPVAGWIEGVKVADAIIFAYARGKLSYFPGDPKGVMDIIPADLVANGVILSMTKVLKSPGEINIYQCCSRGSSQPTIRQLIDIMILEANLNYKKYPKLFRDQQPAEKFKLVSKGIFDTVVKTLDASFNSAQQVKSLLGLDAQKSKMHRNISTAKQLSTVFSFYGYPKYRFKNDRLLALAKELGQAGESEYQVDPSSIDWNNYFGPSHLTGLEQYALKSTQVTEPEKKIKGRKQEAA